MNILNANQWFVVTLLVSILTGCGVGERYFISQDTDEARMTWQSENIRNYNMTVESACLDMLPVFADVIVREGKVVDAYVPGTTDRMTYYGVHGGPEAGDLEVQSCYKTVEEIFDIIDQATSDSFSLQDLTVEFDETYGYPKLTNFNHPRVSHGFYYKITKFKIIETKWGFSERFVTRDEQ